MVGMIVGTLRDGSESESFFSDDSTGFGRRARNPQDSENKNIYTKLVYSPSETQSLTLVVERFEGDSKTDVLSAVGTLSRGVLTNSEIGIDKRSRERFSLDYRLAVDSMLFDSVGLLAYFQNSDAQQNTFSERVSRGVTQDRSRTSFYEQEIRVSECS